MRRDNREEDVGKENEWCVGDLSNEERIDGKMDKNYEIDNR